MRRNAEEFRDNHEEAVNAINRKHYMDDYFDSTPTVETAVARALQVVKIHKAGGFTIRSWVSNSSEVLASVPPELRSDSALTIDSGETATPTEKTLGLKWMPREDIFSFKLSARLVTQEAEVTQPTKGHVLRMCMSVFDPLGYLAFHTVSAKVLLQRIWRTGVSWDQPLPDDLVTRWKEWWQMLLKLSELSVPRPYSEDMTKRAQVQLHVFGDASESAFAAAAYLRVTFADGSAQVAFVLGKTRVAPLKPLSIPRLELQAAVMASRMTKTIKSEHDISIDSVTLWTDSVTALRWIQADARRFKPFVAHRVGEITEVTDVSQWRWVPTDENPADAATRPRNDSGLAEKWLKGPDFLRHPESEWPVEKPGAATPREDDSVELKNEFKATAREAPTLALPEIERYSSWNKLVRTTAWVVRYIRNLRASATGKPPVAGELRPSEFRRAQELWWLRCQADAFPTELLDLRKTGSVATSSTLCTLSPRIDEAGLIRMAGRIRTAPAGSLVELDPVILPPKHPFTRLLLQQTHEWCGHNGQAHMTNEIRRSYWIPTLRAVVRRTWTECQKCKNDRAQPVVPQMGALPDSRLAAFVRPFTHCGLDYFGPMEVTIGRRHKKRYGALFTCLTTRAIHLELARDLTTDSAIMAIRRMASRRGQPGIIYSDNGTNFRGADSELRKAVQDFDHTKIQGHLTPKGTEWRFNPPAAPHMGGAWERLVRSVKTALKAVLTARAPREDVLVTLLAEVESLLNSRPLTHVSCDATDEDSLTPNHFLLGTPSNHQAPGEFDEAELCMRKQWRIVQVLADHFWRRWLREYLPTLTRRTKWHQRQQKEVKVNDIVVIADRDLPRGSWPKGTITAVYPGTDGHVRVADVKTASGTYRRPVSKICVLDVLNEGDA
ncbi:uncharacterized protein LOC135826682 [Sycon ciliatum]|uniref:uncharacterized protein LOC135826682 n=1 Tax=Sycon ciliatum TaxID=27933 RepID=UPI0031F624B4